MKNIIFSSLFAMYFLVGYSQNSLSGSVKSVEHDLPLEQVNIYLPQLEKGAVSDVNGVFQLNNLPIGTYKLVLSMLGLKRILVLYN